jgi:hypothetical protein
MYMDISQILIHIDDEIARLQKAKVLLTGEQATRNIVSPQAPEAGKRVATNKKRTMSAEGRARIAAAQKARWAKAKRAA